MAEEFNRQTVIDDEHLKLLSIGYMISAATTALFSLFSGLYVIFGVGMVVALSRHSPIAENTAGPPTALVGWIIAAVGIAIFLFTLAMAALKFRVAVCIKQRKSRTFCMVMAGIGCVAVPYGTILGVFTFMVFSRPSVMRQFQTGIAPVSNP